MFDDSGPRLATLACSVCTRRPKGGVLFTRVCDENNVVTVRTTAPMSYDGALSYRLSGFTASAHTTLPAEPVILYTRQREMPLPKTARGRDFSCGTSSWVLTATCFSPVRLRPGHHHRVRRGDCFFHFGGDGRPQPFLGGDSHVATAAEGYCKLLRAVRCVSCCVQCVISAE